MKIDSDTIKHVSSLAKLNLTAAESRKMQADIGEILKAFDVLNALPTESEPSFQPVKMEAALREDEKEPPLVEPLANTKHKEKGFFKGPKAV